MCTRMAAACAHACMPEQAACATAADGIKRQLKHDREAVETLRSLLSQHAAVRTELRQVCHAHAHHVTGACTCRYTDHMCVCTQIIYKCSFHATKETRGAVPCH